MIIIVGSRTQTNFSSTPKPACEKIEIAMSRDHVLLGLNVLRQTDSKQGSLNGKCQKASASTNLLELQ